MKLKRFSILLAITLLLGTLFSTMVSAAETEKDNLYALGDSITYGWNLDPANPGPSSQAFPSLIGDGAFHVINVNYPGWKSSDLLSKLTEEVNANPAFLKDAEVVTLDIGSNDLLGAVGFKPSAPAPIDLTSPAILANLDKAQQDYQKNLISIITLIKSQTDAPIILYNIYNPFPVVPEGYPNAALINNLHSVGEQIIPVANQVIATIAAQSDALLADAFTAFKDKQAALVLPGDIHPNVTGHQVLAGLADELLATLDDNSNGDDQTPGQDNNNGNNQTPTPTPPVTSQQPVAPAPAAAAATTSATANSLPNTATSSYNFAVAGFVLIVAGLSVVVIQRKREKSSKAM